VFNTELSGFLGHWLPRLETELREALASVEAAVAPHYGMMHYHMGWVDENFRPQRLPTGKRLRPMLCLLACAEVGGDPATALPAAVAIEILHNFSLVHDDIEDGDETRRHRPTVWKVWGIPHATNVGDGMFALAYGALQGLARRGLAAETTLTALHRFTQACLALTEGQYLDMSFEERSDVTVAEYLRMIQGKTAALVGTSLAIGALVGGAGPEPIAALQRFGEELGLAFQIQDDILGIWGDPEVTGKPAGNDLLRRKKSLPLLYALNHDRVGEEFATLFSASPGPGQLERALTLLEQARARPYTEALMDKHHQAGVAALYQAIGPRAADSALLALAESLQRREQ
jgi:geranylgeranyl diphosphate synthase, type I